MNFLQSHTRLFCAAANRDAYLTRQMKKLAYWKFKGHLQQQNAEEAVRACYAVALDRLTVSGQLSPEMAQKWREIDANLLNMHRDRKSLMWHSGRRISRDYVSSPSGFGRVKEESASE